MHKYKMGELHSGLKHGPVVTNRKQAIAISMREAGMPKKSHHSPGRGDGFDADSFRPTQASAAVAQGPERGQVGANVEGSRMKRV